MTSTTNLGLTQYAAVDKINFLTEYNVDMGKIDTSVGKLSTLTTTNKSSVVGAINEILANFKKYMYNVGDVITKTVLVTPAQMTTEYGGTWVAWGSGRVPVGVDTAQTEFDTVEEVGGSKNHTNTEAEMFKHAHQEYLVANAGSGSVNGYAPASSIQFLANASIYLSNATSPAGSSTAYSIMNPYITCYMWKKTA